MKLLLDQGLPRSTVRHLADAGIDAEHVGDLGLSTASDEDILEAARQRQATIITLDADFHQLLATSKVRSPSVVRIRIEGQQGAALATLLVRVISVAGADIDAGAVVSVTANRIRVRALPIIQ